jgi:hypothetical protein
LMRRWRSAVCWDAEPVEAAVRTSARTVEPSQVRRLHAVPERLV